MTELLQCQTQPITSLAADLMNQIAELRKENEALRAASPPEWQPILEFYADESNFNTDTEGNLIEAHESPLGPLSFRHFGYRARKFIDSLSQSSNRNRQ